MSYLQDFIKWCEYDCSESGHEFVDRVIGPFHPDFVRDNQELLEELCQGMSAKVCKKCGWPGS